MRKNFAQRNRVVRFSLNLFMAFGLTVLSFNSYAAGSIPSQLSFELIAPGYDEWEVRVKDGQGTTLTGHLDVPSWYSGKDWDNKLTSAPVTTIANLSSNITTVYIPDGITTIKDNGFSGSPNLKSVVIPNSVTSIGAYAFKSCPKLSSVVLSPNNNCSSSFVGCNIKKGAYPVGKRFFVADIEVAYPVNCVPDSAGLIFDNTLSTFYFAPWNINTLELPATVKKIGPKAIAGCTGPLKLFVKSTVPPSVADDSFEGASISYIYVPYGTKNAYIEAGWSKYASKGIYEYQEDADSISLNSTKVTMTVSETTKLVATVYPDITINKTVTWSSSNENIVTVDQDGNVTAVGIGSATVSAHCGNLSATCSVEVTPIMVTSISVTPSSLTLKDSESMYLTATVFPENATDKTVKWSSSNTTIATVDNKGLVTPVKTGTVNIKATCGTASTSVRVTVVETPATEVILDKTSVSLIQSETVSLTATILPENTTSKMIKWNSNNPGVATVDNNGNVTAVSEGTAIITAKCGNAQGACYVYVKKIAAEKIILNETELTLQVSQTFDLTAEVLPENAVDKTVKWSSGIQFVATVDANGRVRAVSPGVTTITASCGSVKSSCEVTVVPVQTTGITLDKTEKTIDMSDFVWLTATVYPDNTYDKTVIWSSSNESVATVDSRGFVTPINPGSTIITAKCGDVSATCSITVISLVTDISLNPERVNMYVNETLQIQPTIYPFNATNKKISWDSYNDAIATVDDQGNITAVAPGETIIMASSTDTSGIYALCYITVKPALAESLTISPESWNGTVGESIDITAVILPEYTTNKVLKWSSSDTSVAVVNDAGTVTVLKDGSCIIVAETTDGSNLTAQCHITGMTDIDDIFVDENETLDVYTIRGICIKRNCLKSELKQFKQGLYIIRGKKGAVTVLIK